MLLNKSELAAIQSGERSLVFRRWKRASVKSGGTLKTAIGVLAIDAIDKLPRAKITASDAAAAGYASRAQLLAALDTREGDIYRIRLHLAGDDPRIALRQQAQLSEAEFEEVQTKLQRLDAASRIGPWTLQVLQAIEQHPHLAAVELAERTGYDKPWLKLNIRKLKNLGLTISHHPGYELSPRGRTVLARLASKR